MTANSYRIERSLPILTSVISALIGGLVLFLGFVLVWTLGYQLLYAGRIFPGVSVAGVDVSGLSPDDAALKLNQTLSYPITGKVVFRKGTSCGSPRLSSLAWCSMPRPAPARLKLGRSGLFRSLIGQIQVRGSGADVGPVVIFDQRLAYNFLQSISTEVDEPVKEAGLSVVGTDVVATPGQAGRSVNLDATLIYLTGQLQSFRDGEVPLVVQNVEPKVMDLSAQAEVARSILSQPLTLAVPNAQAGDPGPWVYEPAVLANMIAAKPSVDGGRSRCSSIRMLCGRCWPPSNRKWTGCHGTRPFILMIRPPSLC